jgi:hypothetical protein
MNKLMMTSLGFLLFSIGLTVGIQIGVGYASHIERVTVLRLENVHREQARTQLVADKQPEGPAADSAKW